MSTVSFHLTRKSNAARKQIGKPHLIQNAPLVLSAVQDFDQLNAKEHQAPVFECCRL
jgi:hypothetical protein